MMDKNEAQSRSPVLDHSGDLEKHDQEPRTYGAEQSQESQERDTASSQDIEKVEKPVNPWLDPTSFPEGGTKAWLTVAGAAACLFVSFGWVNCVGIFQDYYETHQLKAYTPSEVAWIPALQGMFLQPAGSCQEC